MNPEEHGESSYRQNEDSQAGMDKREKQLHNMQALKKRRRELRKQATPAERKLWSLLRRRQLEGRRFRRQHSVGPYVLDFYCSAEKLAVELDGQGHRDPFRREYDDTREAFLRQQGIQVIRFENRQVFEQPDVVLAAISSRFDDDTE